MTSESLACLSDPGGGWPDDGVDPRRAKRMGLHPRGRWYGHRPSFPFQERIYTPAGGRMAAAWARPTSGSSMVVQASAVFQAVDGPTHQLAAQSEGVCHTPHPPYNLFSSFFTGANFNELMVISLHSNKFRMNTDPKEIILSDVIEPSGFHFISDRRPYAICKSI